MSKLSTVFLAVSFVAPSAFASNKQLSCDLKDNSAPAVELKVRADLELGKVELSVNGKTTEFNVGSINGATPIRKMGGLYGEIEPMKLNDKLTLFVGRDRESILRSLQVEGDLRELYASGRAYSILTPTSCR